MLFAIDREYDIVIDITGTANVDFFGMYSPFYEDDILVSF